MEAQSAQRWEYLAVPFKDAGDLKKNSADLEPETPQPAWLAGLGGSRSFAQARGSGCVAGCSAQAPPRLTRRTTWPTHSLPPSMQENVKRGAPPRVVGVDRPRLRTVDGGH